MTTLEKSQHYLMPTYGRFPLTLVRGEGARVWDEQGREYLDFCMGIATCSLGHCHQALTTAIKEQCEQLMHCSNLYHIPAQADLAELLVEKVVQQPGKVFFSNSGAEANDGLIKLARKFGQQDGRHEIITFTQSFHGRTLGAMAATGQEKIHGGFGPLMPGFVYSPLNDLAALEEKLTEKTCAFLLEPVQGEGGVNPATPKFLRALAELAKKHNLLLMIDEVQAGFGRTGHLNGYQAIVPELVPDAISWAKGMGGGFPIGSFFVAEKHASLLGPGTHGSTYGGNPLACAASHAVIMTILEEKLAENATARAKQIREHFAANPSPLVKGTRGHGLLMGLILDAEAINAPDGSTPALHLCRQLMEKGLLTVPAGPETLRLLPPLNVTEAEVQQALAIFAQLAELVAEPSRL